MATTITACKDLQDVVAATNDTSESRYPRLAKNLTSSGVRPSEPTVR